MIIGFAIFMIVICSIGALVLYKLSSDNKKQMNSGENDKGEKIVVGDTKNTAQGFLPFENIEDSMIDLGEGSYRMIIEVGSVNYYLRTAEEQNMTEDSFRRIITGWDFPFAFYIQTRELDNRKILKKTREDIAEVTQNFPILSEYGRKYTEYIENLSDTIGNNKIKKKYIVIGCDDAKKMEMLSKDEKQDYAFEVLRQRSNLVMDNLRGLGLQSRVINSNGLAEVLFQAINKKNGGVIDGITDGSFMSGVVEGEVTYTDSEFSDKKVAILIDDFINRLNLEVINDRSASDRKKVQALQLVKEASKLKNISIEEVGFEEFNRTENDEDFFVL